MSGLVALSSFAGLGYLIGALVAHVLAVPIAAIVSLAAVALTPASGSVSFPTYPFDVIAGLAESPSASAYRLLFFGLVTIAFVIGSAWLTTRRVANSSVLPTVAVFGVLLVLFSLTQSRPLVARDIGVTPDCQKTAGVVVCVHPARREMLGSLAQIVEAQKGALADSPGSITGVEDGTLWRSAPEAVVSIQLQGQSRESWEPIAARDIALQVSGAIACDNSSMSVVTPAVALSEPATAAYAVGIWLVREAGFNGSLVSSDPSATRLADKLSSATPEQVGRFVSDNLSLIQNCSGSPSTFPR